MKVKARGCVPIGLLLLVVAFALSPASATYTTPEEQRLIDWAVSEGARLRVTISRNKEGVRGGLAAPGRWMVQCARAIHEGLAGHSCVVQRLP